MERDHAVDDNTLIAAKLAASAADVVFGRFTAGAGAGEEIAVTAAGRALIDDATAAAQRTTLALGTGDSPQFTAANIGHATDTTLSRSSAGVLAVEGNVIYAAGGTDVPVVDGGTGASSAQLAAQNLKVPHIILKTGVAVSGAANTSENTLGTISLPANALGANGCLIIEAHVTVNNNANAKTLRGRFSGIGGTILFSTSLASVLNFVFRWIVFNQNATNSQLAPPGIGTSFGTSASASVTAAVDTTAATTFLITGQKAVAGDVITLNNVIATLYADGT